MKRMYYLIKDRASVLVNVCRTTDGKVIATSQEPFEYPAHSHTFCDDREVEFVEWLLENEQKSIPTLNLDAPVLTNKDACLFAELDPYFMCVIDRLSRSVSIRLDLAYSSEQNRAEHCLRLARKWLKLGQEAAELEREINAVCVGLTKSPAAVPLVFDSSDGDSGLTEYVATSSTNQLLGAGI